MEELRYKYTLHIRVGEPNDSRNFYTQTIPLSSSYMIRNDREIINVNVQRPRAGYLF